MAVLNKRGRPWPYPRNREELIQVVMTSLAIIFIGLIGVAAQAEHYKNKPLTEENLRQAASSLDGYASEAAVLSGQAIHGRSPQNYRQAYFGRLGDQSSQVTGFIASHSAPGSLAPTARLLVERGNRLNKYLRYAGDATDAGRLYRIRPNFQELERELGSMGENK